MVLKTMIASLYEVVYSKDGVLLTEKNDPVNMGTYNYASKGAYGFGFHVLIDVSPYDSWGNVKGAHIIDFLEHAQIGARNKELAQNYRLGLSYNFNTE